MSAAVTSDWETGEVAVPTILRHAATAPSPGNAKEQDVDAAATAFGSLRLVAEPSADPCQRQQQPSPQHAHYDPNAMYPQPVSAATATAAVARFGQLDPVLLAGLENARERLSLLKLEDQIVRFLKNPRESQLSFPPLSSYHRLIVHRLAERCCLEHQTADLSQSGYDSNSARVVTLFKTPQSTLPRVLLIDLSADMQPPTVTPASAPKIMVRKRGAPRGATNGGRGAEGSDPKNQQRTIEDRERAYAEARARIFGEDGNSTTDSSSSSTSSATTATATAKVTATASNGSVGPKFGGNAQAAGPDGSRGFARGGRGSAGANPQRPQRETSPSAGGGASANGRGQNGNSNGNTRQSAGDDGRGQPQPQNWKESKVLWRNREQELNDPDFTRNHDAYRPARDPHFGGGGGRFGAQQQPPYYNYDGSRSFGYAGAGQPPYPGRGRSQPPNEYNRIDPMHRHHQVPPPPQPSSEFYRHHAQHHPPPPPPGGNYHSSYSPHGGRGGGGYAGGAPPPPLPPSSYQHQQQMRRGSANGSYHDDFPPLGK